MLEPADNPTATNPIPLRPPQRWAVTGPKKNLIIGVGDMLTSNDPQAILVTYSLGSCVAVAIYDPAVKVGGLLHVVLPDSAINVERAADRPFMFVDTGVPSLFKAVYALGGIKQRLLIKVAGGAEILALNKTFNVGPRNADAVINLLHRNDAPPSGADTGGRESRTVRLELSTGNFTVELPGKKPFLL